MNPEIHSPMSVGNEKSLTSNHEIRSAEENLGNHNENYYSASSSSTSISSSSSSSSLSASSSQLSQIIVIVSYVLGAILCLFILLAIIIIIQRKCKHYLHFKHQCCKQLTVETTGISPNQSGGFYSPLSLIGTCGSTNHHPHGVNSLLNYNVVNTMNIPEAAKLLQSLSTLSPNTRTTLTTTTTDNFVHNNNNNNCLSNNGGNVGGVGVNQTVLHHPNNILQYTMNNNSNTLATESNSVIVNNNNNRLFGTACANSIGGVGDGRISKLDYASTIGQPLPPPPPPTLPNGLLLPCIPQTGVVGGIGMNHHNHPGTTDQHHHQITEQPTSMYMQTNAANRLVGNDLNSLNGMSKF